MHSYVQSGEWVCIRLPNGDTRVIQFCADSTISLSKYGVFPANLVVGRPYHTTYEILDKVQGRNYSELRRVPASELHADVIAEEEAAAQSERSNTSFPGTGAALEVVGDGEIVMRTNRSTIDSNETQTLTMEEIEILKKEGGTDAGKDIIAKIMQSHTKLDEKTSFALAKYKLLKTKKYLRQFTVLPLDVGSLTNWLIEDKDPGRILEMREECLGLIGCWGNVHYSGESNLGDIDDDLVKGGRWLCVDEVGGLLVAAMAERMGFLYPEEDEDGQIIKTESEEGNKRPHLTEEEMDSAYATSNTITLIHANSQPNLSLLKYFNFSADTPQPSHPLTPNLRTLSWLQLLRPESDTAYATLPPQSTPEELATWKSGKRGTYYRKRRRYLRTRQIVDEARNGSHDGLLIASSMEPTGILRALVPLLRGGAPVAIYSPTIEPLCLIADYYSTSRRTAFIASPPAEGDLTNWQGDEDFPLNPTLLLGVSVQTSRVRRWQVLPGRTHPTMTARGGAEGFVLTATRVIPAEGRVEARGKYKKRRIADEESEASAVATPAPEILNVEMVDV